MLAVMERIVVGVDGSANSRAALEFAANEAERRGARLDVVMAWHLPYVSGVEVWMPTAHFDNGAIETGYRGQLDTLIAGADVPASVVVEPILVEGPSSSSLLSAAEGASLLVVGRRGRGGFLGLLLGSVSLQVAAHAPCPVVIVPAADEDR